MGISAKLDGLLNDWLLGKLNAPVLLQDQDTTAFDIYLTEQDDGPFTLNSDSVIDTRTIEVVTPHTIAATDFLFIFDGESAQQVQALTVVNDTGFDTITIDTPLDKSYLAASTEIYTEERDMAVNGSGTRVIFRVPSPVLGDTPVVLDVTRILFNMAFTGAGDDGTFGDQTALTNGCVFRKIDASGDITTIFNFKTNGDFAQVAFDAQYTDKAPSGENGLRVRYTFAGQDKHGVVLRINPGDRLEFVIQDNLTGLSSFTSTVGGHVAN